MIRRVCGSREIPVRSCIPQLIGIVVVASPTTPPTLRLLAALEIAGAVMEPLPSGGGNPTLSLCGVFYDKELPVGHPIAQRSRREP